MLSTGAFLPTSSAHGSEKPFLTVRRGLFLITAAFCLTPWASPPITLALGMALALTLGNPFRQASKKAARVLLQSCVVLLGFGMNLTVVVRAGTNGALLAAATIGTTFVLGHIIGKRLRINKSTSALISAGTAICGGSAIAAVGSVIGAAEGEMTVAIGTVFLLNAAALYLFPPIGHALGLSQTQFGTWGGIAIHDISSVVGAASHYGLSALQTATAVKLSRALWIVPVSFAAAFAFRVPQPKGAVGVEFGFEPQPTVAVGRVQIPWFIGLFVLASIARSVVPGAADAAPVFSRVATAGLTLTLFLIGAGLSRKTLRAVGWQPLAQGLLLWLFISGTSLLVVMRLVR